MLACFPRARGDGPCILTGSFEADTFSPRARGWTRGELIVPHPAIVFPARAGMDPRVLRRQS